MVCSLGVTTAMAQIPNGGFELWHTDEHGVLVPDDWTMVFPTSVAQTCEQEEGVVEEHAARLFQVPVGKHVARGTLMMEFPLTQRPAVLKGMVTYASDPGVDCSINVWLRTSDPEYSNYPEAYGAFHPDPDSEQSDWTEFTIVINYEWEAMPDSATIMITTGWNTDTALGSTIAVDDLHFEGTTGVESGPAAAPSLSVGPNPARDVLHLRADGRIRSIHLVDMTGRTVGTMTVDSPAAEMPVTGLPAGPYLLRAEFASGASVVQRFLKD